MGVFGIVTKKDLKIAILEDRLKRGRRREKAISMQDPTLAKIFNWRIEGQDETIQHPYEQVPIVYGCVRARATNLAQVPMDVMKGEEELSSGPAVDLLESPNPRMDRNQLIEGIVTCLDLKGNAYVMMDEQVRAGWPLFLWLVNPANTELAFDKNTGLFVGYWLARKGQDKQFIEAARMIHWRYFNLRDDLLGLSPLDVAKLTYETEWDAIRYNRNFFKNDATPGLAYTHPNRLPDPLRQMLERKYIDKRKGVEQAHGAVLLEGGLDVKVVGLAQKDIQFLEQRKFNREEICMIYKVPKAEVELYEDMNYATAQSADRSFWKKTLVPLGRLVQAGFNRALFAPRGLACRFDFQAVDALNTEMLERVEAAAKLVNIGYPLNMVNRRLNLGFDDVDWGDEPRQMPTSLALLEAPEAQEKTLAPGPQANPLQVIDKAMLEKRWHELMEPLLPLIGKAGRKVQEYFNKVKQRIMAQYAKRVGGSWVVEKTDWREIDERAIRDAFKADELQAAVENYMQQAIGLGVLSVAGTPFRIDSPQARELLRSKLIKILEVNQSGADMVVDKLRKVLDDAIAEGLGNEQTAERIFEALGDSMQNLQSRARTIARTEINGSFNQSRYEAIKATEPTHLRWISSRDDKVRDSHQNLDGHYVEFGKAFQTSTGNSIRYPHDPQAPAEEVINCFLPAQTVSGSFLGGSRVAYSGPVKVIETARGNSLSVTPNHPIPTSRGWRYAHQLRKGDYLFGYSGSDQRTRGMEGPIDDQQSPSRIEQVFAAMQIHGSAMIVQADFHGDGIFGQGQIEVVSAKRKLCVNRDTHVPQFRGESFLESADWPESSAGLLDIPRSRNVSVSSRGPGSRTLTLDKRAIGLEPAPLETLRIGPAADLHTSFAEAIFDDVASPPIFTLELQHAHPGLVVPDEIIEIRDVEFTGHVFDLQSPYGWMIAQNLICSNCRCVMEPIYFDEELNE